MIETPEELIKAECNLVGVDGNAFAIMSKVMNALHEAGNSREVIDTYLEEVRSSDYDHLLAVSVAYTTAGDD